MKRVVKQAEPAGFTVWKSMANEDWQPSYADLRKPQKGALHEALIAEQAQVCCYCGRRISLKDSHIEHFRPQAAFEDLALDYGNLHASCNPETPRHPLHCGHAKGNAFDKSRIISPQDAGCERRFIYTLTGAILAADAADASAAYMVRLLQLDINFLRGRRAAALESAFDDAFVESASAEELMQLAMAYRAPNENEQMDEFGHVLSRFAEQLLGAPV
jgi:uncharacterized protein (TIGR02646 family)